MSTKFRFNLVYCPSEAAALVRQMGEAGWHLL